MRLSKRGYFADFVVYPPVAIVLVVAATWPGSTLSWRESVFVSGAGIAAWTLLEYVIHRVLLHGVRYFAMMHEMHHDDPGGVVGTSADSSELTIEPVIFLLDHLAQDVFSGPDLIGA